MNKLIIGAPFGNYLSFPGATQTLGTYTLEHRAGLLKRWWRVVSTVRYYPGIGAWKNKLGLPNPGIAALEESMCNGYKKGITVSDKIISISARNTNAWLELLIRTESLGPEAIEMNVSCPNVGEIDASDYEVVFQRAAVQAMPVIVKLPPVNYQRPLALALSQGIQSFHCCNTLPTGNGGLSGKPLKPLSLACVREVAQRRPAQLADTSHRPRLLIGGGGITSVEDICEYIEAGATHVSIASMLFNPFNWCRVRLLAAYLETEV